MREGWTYKKLGEVAKISSGKAIPSSDIIDTFSEGLYPCYGGNGLRGYVDHFSNDGLVPVIGRVGALCGNVHLPQGKFYATEHALVVYLKTKDKPHYIEYLLSSLNLRQYAKGVAQPVLSASTLSEITIPVPPLSEQQRIVNELDLLSGIIEKKKAQLKEYDQLAQSIFYDMFGDPVTNEKGWEVKKLGEVCEKITDGTHNSPVNTEKGDYMYITAKNIKKDGIILDNITYVNADVHKSIYERCNPQYGDILYIKDGITTGIATINTLKEEFSLLSSVALLKPKEYLINHYLKSVLNMPSQYASIRENMGGAAITRLTIAKINVITIPIPPLSLQQSFASKIEAIERQKALIQQSITETETLFNSRMDYWFS